MFEGFEVDCVADGALALGRARIFMPDLVVLDIMLPNVNGFELCGALRQHGRMPVLILTARSQKADKLRGLNLGADDYITKPFDLDEFLARVNAVLRRSRPSADTLHLGPVSIDFLARTARQGKREIHLTHREFELLKYLAERPGHVVSRDELLREVWEYPDGALTRSVDHAIARLRRENRARPPTAALHSHGGWNRVFADSRNGGRPGTQGALIAAGQNLSSIRIVWLGVVPTLRV